MGNVTGYPYKNWLYVAVAIYFCILLFIGFYSRRYIKNSDDFVLAGRKLSFFLLVTGIVATWYCAGTLIGGAANAYIFGLHGVIFDPFSASLCLIIAGLFFSKIMYRTKYKTVCDVFYSRYGEVLGIVSTLIMIFIEFGWIGSQLVAFASILKVYSGLSITMTLYVSSVVVMLYTYWGGLWSVSLTNALQFILFFIVFIVGFLFIINYMGGFEIFTKVSYSWAKTPVWSFFPLKGSEYLGYTGLSGWSYYIAAWLSIGVGSLCAQDLMQRVLAARDEKVAVKAVYSSSIIYLILGLVGPLLGIVLYVYNPNLKVVDTETIIPWIGANMLSPVFSILFFVAILAVLMSTCSAAALAASSLIGCNILKTIKKDVTDETILFTTKIMIPIVIIISMFLAFRMQSVYKLMVVSWSILLVGLMAAFIAAFFWKKANHTGALASLLVGIYSWIGLILYFIKETSKNNTGVVEGFTVYWDWAIWDAVYISSTWAFIVSLITLIIVSLLTQKIDPPKPLVNANGEPLEIKKWFGNPFK
jgi:Na+/proline symporter